jgi:glycosyltransferase involved in cell wall biosynthesis
MVLTEALARGLPVVASDVGGVAQAVTGALWGAGTSAAVPGTLVPPGDPHALADRLRGWLTDAGLRAEWRRRARQRRRRLPGWEGTARRAATVIERVAAPRVS